MIYLKPARGAGGSFSKGFSWDFERSRFAGANRITIPREFYPGDKNVRIRLVSTYLNKQIISRRLLDETPGTPYVTLEIFIPNDAPSGEYHYFIENDAREVIYRGLAIIQPIPIIEKDYGQKIQYKAPQL